MVRLSLLVRWWLPWKVLIFLIDLYFINECLLWVAFHSFYDYSMHHLVVLNSILMIILFLNIVFKVMMTPKLP